MSGSIVRFSDMRAADVCWHGARLFLLRHNFDPAEFRRNGISAKKLEETGDAIALRVVEVARGRAD